MIKRSRILSLLLTMALVFSLASALDTSADAASPMPDFRITDDGVLSWSYVDGADRYYLRGFTGVGILLLRDDGYTFNNALSWNEKGLTFDLKKYMDGNKSYEEKTYNVWVQAVSGDEILDYESRCQYDYVSAIPQLSTPQNLRWNGKTISWDPVENADRYVINVKREPEIESVWMDRLKVTEADLTQTSDYHKSPPVEFSPDEAFYFTVKAVSYGNYRDSLASDSETVLGTEVLNGYDSAAPARDVMVTGGIADRQQAKAGQLVNITAAEVSADSSFTGWNVLKGDVRLADKNSRATSFIMPSTDV
ncbi:MAG: hypothetical protein IJG63_02665, partial [Oscillospiraceae bacterium]|nr:hypothetical protein [Oscillospiraceae bacterium]